MIKIERIVKKYGERTVLDISSLEFKKGEIIVIVGPNGSGKSTLLKVISGIIKADISDFTAEGRILYLPQQSIPFNKTAEKNIIFAMENEEDKEKRTEKILSQLKLIHLKNKNARTFSGGECQRLALGRVLVNPCDILVLDEPSSAADIEGTEVIENAIKKYKEENNCSVIMTTHSPVQAKKLADRIIMLCDGRIIEDGKADEVFENSENEWARKFIAQWKFD